MVKQVAPWGFNFLISKGTETGQNPPRGSLQRLPDDVVKQGQSGMGGVKGREKPVMGTESYRRRKGRPQDRISFSRNQKLVGLCGSPEGDVCRVLPEQSHQATYCLSRKLLPRARKWPRGSNSPIRQPGDPSSEPPTEGKDPGSILSQITS